MKKMYITAIALVIIITLSGILIVTSGPQNNKTPVYVGVTYCGNSEAEAKQLIDRVKGYTNLFVLQSGELQRDFDVVNEIGDYVVDCGLYFLPYFGNFVQATFSSWLDSATQRWGNHLIGVYYSDELGGKMLDDYTEFTDPSGDVITKTRYSDIVVKKVSGETIHYEINGNINVLQPGVNGQSDVYLTYFPNGTVTVKDFPNTSGSTTYQQLLNERPFQNYAEAAQRFEAKNQNEITFVKNQTTVFTSDYVLYWYDYQAGYDVLLTQLGWNISLSQQIALCRGAATAQEKDWGAIVTWKYNKAPYIASAQEISSQLKTAYECGAKYLILFNYYEEGKSNPYGTLTDEHFDALEKFWNEVVKNPSVISGSVKADSVLVLPKNFGGGLRWRADIVWGVFRGDEASGQLYDLTQSALTSHGYNLDIVYDNSAYPLSAQYKNIIKPQD
ncbi:MAG: hypothetical protein ACQCN5_10235 [Candidatus Bathyarchaeia archaeon]|jgi:hypothetical protein